MLSVILDGREVGGSLSTNAGAGWHVCTPQLEGAHLPIAHNTDPIINN